VSGDAGHEGVCKVASDEDRIPDNRLGVCKQLRANARLALLVAGAVGGDFHIDSSSPDSCFSFLLQRKMRGDQPCLG